ncbi:MAG: orotate phosphoribosyltransferase [candidate division WOR-3 bacterium]|nr:orotate phosphoribosyltransferase [candidate division WOR-3 bacterium]
MLMNIEKILEENQVLKTGHFLLTSGLHSDKYFEKFRILENPQLVAMFGQMIVSHFKDKNISIVCGPTTGGIIIAYEVARQMGVRCVFAELKSDGSGRVIRRGFVIPDGARILLVDDVLTTGGSIRETIQALNQFSGELVGISVIVDRSGLSVKSKDFFGLEREIDFFACYQRTIENFSPEKCPLCAAKVPLETPGRGGK